MIVFPNAKINIGLYITEKRSDGYHNIESCFYPIPWCDVLECVPASQTSFTATGLPIPNVSAHNLCLKAYELLAADFALPPVHIHLHKILPIGAGLGGGSADASFLLNALAEMFLLKVSKEQLVGYAAKLGSDCAFFIANTPAFCYERGDRFEPLALSLQGKKIVLVYPNLHIATAEAYSAVHPAPAPVDLREVLLRKPVQAWADLVSNDFEKSLFPKYPFLADIKEALYEAGALYASMSGSGSAIYGIFDEVPQLVFPESYQVWQGVL